jgi:hypothetical protein
MDRVATAIRRQRTNNAKMYPTFFIAEVYAVDNSGRPLIGQIMSKG